MFPRKLKGMQLGAFVKFWCRFEGGILGWWYHSFRQAAELCRFYRGVRWL
jgi:hypothetical protein